MLRAEDIRRQNERYYFCQDYAWPLWMDKVMPFVLLLVMTVISLWIRRLFMKQMYFRRAAESMLVDDQDVMQWVNSSMESDYSMVLPIILVNFIVAVFIILCVTRVIKSYDLYKCRWIRIAPILLYTCEMAAMMFYYREAGIGLLIIVTFLKLFPSLIFPRLLYPLESRPTAKGETGLTIIFTFAEKLIFQKL